MEIFHYKGNNLIFHRIYKGITLFSYVQIIALSIHEDKICPFSYLESLLITFFFIAET